MEEFGDLSGGKREEGTQRRGERGKSAEFAEQKRKSKQPGEEWMDRERRSGACVRER